jgi:hypothetical protein
MVPGLQVRRKGGEADGRYTVAPVRGGASLKRRQDEWILPRAAEGGVATRGLLGGPSPLGRS